MENNFSDARIILAKKKKACDLLTMAKTTKNIYEAVNCVDSAIRILAIGDLQFFSSSMISLVYSVLLPDYDSQEQLLKTFTFNSSEVRAYINKLYSVYGDRRSKELMANYQSRLSM